MGQSLVYTLLALALLLPLIGAAALRALAGRLSDTRIAASAALVMAVAIGSTFVLARSNVDSLRIGDLTLLLPIAPVDPPLDDLPIAEVPPPAPTRPALPTLRPTPTDTLSATDSLTATAEITSSATLTPTLVDPATLTPTIEPTLAPTATITPTVAPTATLTPTATLAPSATPAPPPPPGAPAQPRTYTVQPGDTIRSIAERFNVTVAALLRANKLSPAQADTIRPGQVLAIPAPATDGS